MMDFSLLLGVRGDHEAETLAPLACRSCRLSLLLLFPCGCALKLFS